MNLNPWADNRGPGWHSIISNYSQPNRRKAIRQLVNTFVPYISLWILMIYSVEREYSYWLTLILSVPASLFLVRIFIFFHDCCHSSFFASRRANRVTGYICGTLTFTAYDDWRSSHLTHHLTVGDLDRRGTGDVQTMTVDEYLNMPVLQRLRYRIYRNPIVLFILGPVFLFPVRNRFFRRGTGRAERKSVFVTNLLITAVIVTIGQTFGYRLYFLIQMPVIFMAGLMGIWLFYVQHQFQGVYWVRHEVFRTVDIWYRNRRRVYRIFTRCVIFFPSIPAFRASHIQL